MPTIRPFQHWAARVGTVVSRALLADARHGRGDIGATAEKIQDLTSQSAQRIIYRSTESDKEESMPSTVPMLRNLPAIVRLANGQLLLTCQRGKKTWIARNAHRVPKRCQCKERHDDWQTPSPEGDD